MAQKNPISRLNPVFIAVPLVCAVVFRFFFFDSLTGSPFKYYTWLKGLDMVKLLKWGIDAVSGGACTDIYIYTVSVLCRIFSPGNTYEAVIILQLAMGVLTVFFTSMTAWYLSRNRYVVLVSGCLMAVYGPKLMYEGFILKSTMTVFLYAAALYFPVYAREKKYSILSLLFTGVSFGLVTTMRFDGLLLVLLLGIITFQGIMCDGKTPFMKNLILVFGFLLTNAVFYAMNDCTSMANSYVRPDAKWISYIYTKGSEPDSTSVNLTGKRCYEDSQSLSEKAAALVKLYSEKAWVLLGSSELPCNINYYFFRDCLPYMKWFPGPLLLIPLALSGLILLLLAGTTASGKRFILAYMIGTFVPIMLFLPLARYKIVFSPVYSICAGLFIVSVITGLAAKKYVRFAGVLIIFCAVFVFELKSISSYSLRVTDFIAYGMAVNLKFPGDHSRSLNAFAMAYDMDPANKTAVYNYSQQLVKNQNNANALAILKKAYDNNPADSGIAFLYVSLIISAGDLREARAILEKLAEDIKIRDSRIFYYYEGEYYSRLGDKSAAERMYEKALVFPDTDEGHTRDLILKRMKGL